MSLLEIHVLGSAVLRAETTPVSADSEALQRLIDDMFETMYAAQGIGLAATQVGRLERLAVVDVEKRPLVLINPEVVLEQGTDRAEEGCLSIPDVYGEVTRARRAVVRALGRDFRPFEVDATDLQARAILHEIDHLHGKLFIDYLSFLKRRAALARWEEQKGKYPRFVRTLVAREAGAPARRGTREEEVL